jgi:hypothetical protein
MESPENIPAAPAVPESLDALLATIQGEVPAETLAAASETGAEDEARRALEAAESQREAYERLRPQLDALAELAHDQDIARGEKTYVALVGDVAGYVAVQQAERDRHYEAGVAMKEVTEDFKAATGKTFYFCSVPWEHRNHDLGVSYVDGWYAHAADLEGKDKTAYFANRYAKLDVEFPPEATIQAARADARSRQYGHGGKIGGEQLPTVSTPAEYLDRTQKWRAYVQSKEYQFNAEGAEYKDPTVLPDKNMYSYSFCVEAQGMTLAALRAHDPEVAAKALAFAESLRGMSSRTLARVGGGIKALSPDEKAKFLTKFQEEKRKFAEKVEAEAAAA